MYLLHARYLTFYTKENNCWKNADWKRKNELLFAQNFKLSACMFIICMLITMWSVAVACVTRTSLCSSHAVSGSVVSAACVNAGGAHLKLSFRYPCRFDCKFCSVVYNSSSCKLTRIVFLYYLFNLVWSLVIIQSALFYEVKWQHYN